MCSRSPRLRSLHPSPRGAGNRGESLGFVRFFMASSCKEQRQALLECLADSPCILAGKPISECVKHSIDADGCRELNQASLSANAARCVHSCLARA